LTPTEAARHGLQLNRDGIRRTAFQILSHPGQSIEALSSVWPELASLPPGVRSRLETDAAYAVYLDRQNADIAAHRRDESILLAEDLDVSALPGLSNEIKARLQAVRPRTLGQAARIEGVTPAALTLLAAHVRKRETGSNPATGASELADVG
jgi:tRNA uridine 5-carboxymethylaminomethyl modification enzyme